ncbi:MAG: HEAT repeat domain-containing protein [Chloroflexia bacterium]|nr:HEAT repeat domain-containing protein [Chloroflexia bacterium]
MQAINLLKNESASQRIKAVNYTEEIQSPSNETIEALINTLETDPSSNVRLAAVYSLSRFKSNKLVKEAFINTLNKQDDPMVQIVIINLLVEMEDVNAVEKLKELLKNKDLHEEVKTQAELGVKILS